MSSQPQSRRFLNLSLLAMCTLIAVSFAFFKAQAKTSSSRPHILIDPGHGGRDLGAQVGPYKESEVVWKWALALKRDLSEKGFQVSLSRDEIGSLPLEVRLARSRSSEYDFILSLHANYLQDPRVKGVEYFVQNPLNFEDQMLQLAHEETKAAKRLRRDSGSLRQGLQTHSDDPQAQDSSLKSFDKQAQLETILADLKKQALLKHSLKIAKLLQQQWKGRLKQGPFDILNQAQAPAVLVELGFLSSPVDQKNLVQPEFINYHSSKMAQVLAEHFVLPRKAKEKAESSP